MDEFEVPKCSHDPDPLPQEKSQEDGTIILKPSQLTAPISVSLVTNSPSNNNSIYLQSSPEVPLIIKGSDQMPNSQNTAPISGSLVTDSRSYNNSTYLQSSPEAPLVIKGSDQIPITTQPRMSTLPSPMSLASPNQPQSLFLQALAQINESSLNFNILNYLQANMKKLDWRTGDITPPDSLTSAPPSYSFVLRQMAARRRPRLMGTFIPSPSFVQHTPPPTYATAFDIYIDPGPPPPPRVYTYGFTSMPVVCPECGYTGMTVTTSKITVCTHLCAFILCLFCCWVCAPLPYVLRSCKDVYHYCRNCRNYLGMYCPTNPENTYPSRTPEGWPHHINSPDATRVYPCH